MKRRVYFVSDMTKVPEQGYEGHLVYVRRVSQSDVEPMRRAEREIEEGMRVNDLQRRGKMKPVYKPENFRDLHDILETGEFGGLFLSIEPSFDFPKVGFTYDVLPKSWDRVEKPGRKIVGQMRVSYMIRQTWWRKVPGYERT